MRKKCKGAIVLFSLLTMGFFVQAQDTLPDFTVQDKGGGRIVVSWTNPYANLVQLAVQRSYDSVKKFSSVYSATSPELPLNGFSDKTFPGAKVFYRIFYVMNGGTYYFSKSKRPSTPSIDDAVYDSRRDKLNESLVQELKDLNSNTTSAKPEKLSPIFVKTGDKVLTLMPAAFKLYRDSILTKTNDSLLQTAEDIVVLQPYSPTFVQRNSQYIFTDRDGFIVVKLPDAATKKYDVTFFEENDEPVLELRGINETQITIDKTNFYHGGWYKFELKENGNVKERNRIYLPADF